MNNIYVEIMPETCEECSCCYYDDYAECYKCPLLLDNEINIYDKDSDCPLKPLSVALAEERKRVVQEIGTQLGLIIDGQKRVCCDGDMTGDKTIMAVLDQIERGM